MIRSLLASLLLIGCKPTEPEPEEPSPLLDVGQTGSWSIPGMTGEAQVVFNAQGVPWIYATNEPDLGRVMGFVVARDRYFYMDLARRLSEGRVSTLLGRDALSTDLESRMTGMGAVIDRVLTLLDEDPDTKAYFEGYAEGINAAVDAVKAGQLPAPTEYGIAAPLVGASEASELMTPFELRDVVAGLVTILYESGFETKDVGRSEDALRIDGFFAGAPLEDLRQAGLREDVWDNPRPVFDVASAPGWLADHPRGRTRPGSARRTTFVPAVSQDALSRLRAHTDRIEKRFGHDWSFGFGSNAWAVAGSASADGRALVASDGHLQLSVPPLFYQIGLDTTHLGDGDVHQVGMITPAMPLLSSGTNGDVGFGQTQLMGDITDWYREQITLDANGEPASALFQGAQVPLQRFDESFTIADVPLLGSVGGTETYRRYTTADGRWLSSIEGRVVAGPGDAAAGETAVNMLGDWVVPADTDGDGLISAISFDYAGLDLSNMPDAIRRYTGAKDVDAFAEAAKDLVAYSLNLVAADRDGHILYSAYQAVPCRGYLDRAPNGVWADGADPNLLLDGTRYGGFTIPITGGRVDTSQGADPYRCVIPWEDYPHEKDPDQGFIVTANNDPGGYTFDGSLTDDARYIGGPWIEGYRADEIQRELQAATSVGATLDDMQRIQGDHTSVIGRQTAPEILRALQLVRPLAGTTPPDESLARAVALYDTHTEALEDAAARIQAWADRGFEAESGVVTFYDTPTPEQVQDSIATTIFNTWLGAWLGHVTKDEGIPGLGWPTGSTGEFRLVKQALEGRGPGNPLNLGSWNPNTEEPAWFDNRNTPEIETSTEIAISALVTALDQLAQAPDNNVDGGYGTTDPESWLWGLRHRVRFTSLLADFFDASDPLFGALINPLGITPDTFPVADGLSSSDPRADLPGFPRSGDHLNVDAANSGTGGRDFDYGDGPTFRFVAALGDAGFEAYNVIPGGQSGLVDSDQFSDQAKLWLGNDAIPVPLEPDAVAAQAVRREVFGP